MTYIPKIIHLTWKQNEVPLCYEPFVQSIKQWNPGWEIRIHDDIAARALIADHFPDLLNVYDLYPLQVQRTDLFRIAVVQHYGGFYMDMDMLCLRPLDSLCSSSLVLGVEKILTQQQCTLLQHQHSVRIANYMFGSMPSHPFWNNVLAQMKQQGGSPIRSEQDVLESTGPSLLTAVYHEQQDKYPDIMLVSNDKHQCLKSCSHQASCHFGDYAAHLHMGSWRWEN